MNFRFKTDDMLVLEAENFSLAAGSCWRSLPWGDNAYASTFLAGGSTFLSRKAFLGAPAADTSLGKGQSCVASANGTIAVAGVYAPLVRFVSNLPALAVFPCVCHSGWCPVSRVCFRTSAS